MVPIVNFTDFSSFSEIIGDKWTKMLNLDKIDFSKEDVADVKTLLYSIFEKKMCTGIVANCNGTVYHARNFDLTGLINPI